MRSRTINDTLSKIWPSGGGRHGLMVMALDCGTEGREFKPRRFQNIFDLMERFDETV